MTLEKPKANTTVHILNYNSSFLLDTNSYSFTTFKGLYHTSFELNIGNFSRALPWSTTEPTEGLTVHPDPNLHFTSKFMENAEFFFFLGNALVRDKIKNISLELTQDRWARVFES